MPRNSSICGSCFPSGRRKRLPASRFRQTKNTTRVILPLFVLVISLFVLEGTSFAQKGLAVLRGTIMDSSGATLPGASLFLIDPSTGLERKAETPDNGHYEFGALNPGKYQLKVSKEGFKAAVLENLLLEDGRVSVRDVSLQLGGTMEQVTVNERPDVITTDTGVLQSLFDNKRVLTTPTNDQNPGPEALLSSLPGIQASGYSVQIAGQGANQLVLNYDGLQNREGNQNVNINFYQEFTATSSNASAESASAVAENSTSKRGTNEFHGGVAYRMFNNAFNSKGFFDPRKTHSLMDEVLGEIGGPVIKNKTFFYVGYMKQLYYAGTFNQASVPTTAMRGGVFPGKIVDPATGQPFANNTIPQNRISSVSLAAQNGYYPQPNQGNANSSANNFGWTHPFPGDIFAGDWWFARGDQQITSKNSLSFRYSSKGAPYVLATSLPDLFRTRERFNNQYTIEDTHIFSPSVVNAFQLARNYLRMYDGETEGGKTPVKGADVISQLGLQGINTNGTQGIAGFPAMSVTGFASLSTNTGGLQIEEHDWVVQDSISWSTGRHVFKFGGNFINYNSLSGVIPDFGSFTFDGSYTGNAYADFLLGVPRTSKRSNPNYNQLTASKEAGLFAQDSFKITPRLTLDYGLRWDYYGLPFLTSNLSYRFDRSTGNIVVDPSLIGKVSPLYPKTITVVGGKVPGDAKLSNLRPRISAAYRIGQDMVVRGGYAEFTERFGIQDRASSGGPFAIGESYTNTAYGTPTFFSFPNPFPSSLALAASPSQSVTGYPLSTDNGVIRQFNVSVEKKLPGELGFRISYIGSRGSGMNYQANINKQQPSLTKYDPSRNPFPQFNQVNQWLSNGSTHYNALQTEVMRRTGWFTFDAHYTWASNLYNYANLENPYNITNQWSHDSTTRRHYAVINSAIELPFGRGRHYMSAAPAWVDAVLGRWSLQTISYFGSGVYFTPQYSGVDASNTNTFGGIPDRVQGVALYPQRQGPRSWFNPAAFTAPQPGHFGNAGAYSIEGQSLISSDLSINKSFALTERVRFNLLGAASDVFNRAHFNSLSTTLSSATAGQYTSVVQDYVGSRSGRRMLSLKARIEF